jgi:hypothetical protein
MGLTSMSVHGPVATKIHGRQFVGDQRNSGPVVLSVSISHFGPLAEVVGFKGSAP